MAVKDDQGNTKRTTGRPTRARPAVALLTCLVALMCIAAPATQAATPPADFVGLGNWSIPTAAQAQTLGQAGLKSWRVGLVWNWVETTQGNRSWGYLDQTIGDGARRGYGALLVLNGCAQWACGTTRTAPAAEPQLGLYRQFIAAAVQRYGRGGTFWAANPTLTPQPVSWQVWNEVNTGQDWPNPSPATYAPFLQAISSTIRGVDPTATIVTSGLTEFPAVASGMTGAKFLDELYDQPGFRESFDVLAMHGYAESALGVVRILDTTHRISAANGDSDRRVWITELGWSSGGPAHPFTTDEAGQARILREGLDTLLACRSRWNLDRSYWFSLSDIASAALGEADYWGHHTGLLRLDGSAKPTWSVFSEYLGGRPLPDGRGDQCGLDGGAVLDLRLPDTLVTSAPTVVGARARPVVTFGATQNARFECSLNGAEWSSCRSPYAAPTTREGRHELVIRAIDSGGLADDTPARAAWIVDLTPPDTRLRGRLPSLPTKASVRLKFSGVDATGVIGYECRQHGQRWRACRSGGIQRLSGRGLRRVQVRAIDRAGNVDPRPAEAAVRLRLDCLRSVAQRIKRGGASRGCGR